MLSHLRITLWLAAGGLVVLYVFFVTLASIPPGRIGGTTLLVAVIAAFIGVRQARLDSELANPAGNPALRRECNRMREERGF